MTIDQALKIMAILSDAQELIRLGEKTGANEAINNAKKRLLLEVYFGEFKRIDGVSQHPEGYNFEQWLEANNTFFADPTK